MGNTTFLMMGVKSYNIIAVIAGRMLGKFQALHREFVTKIKMAHTMFLMRVMRSLNMNVSTVAQTPERFRLLLPVLAVKIRKVNITFLIEIFAFDFIKCFGRKRSYKLAL